MSEWATAQVAFEIASEAEGNYERTVWIPSFHAAGSGGSPIPDAIEAEGERLAEVRCAAEDVLIATPAPDLPAVIWKIEYARKRWDAFEDWPETWWNAVMGDLHRLGSGPIICAVEV